MSLFLFHLWHLIALSAPWLLIGFLLAGILKFSLLESFVKKNMSTPGIRSCLFTSAIGIPLPLCSCGVIPVGTSLRKSGASRGATASFFVSTPEIGVDSAILSYALLGPVLTVARILAAFFSALIVGVSIDYLSKERIQEEAPSEVEACCKKVKPKENSLERSMLQKLRSMLDYGFGTLVAELSITLSIGFLLSALASSFLPSFTARGINSDSPYTLLIALVVSLPVYVCATSLTPLVAVLLAGGLNLGAGLVFLLAGPASNITTMLAIRNHVGKNALFFYLSGITLVSLSAGALLNFLVSAEYLSSLIPLAESLQHHDISITESIAAIVLSCLLLRSLYAKFPIFRVILRERSDRENLS